MPPSRRTSQPRFAPSATFPLLPRRESLSPACVIAVTLRLADTAPAHRFKGKHAGVFIGLTVGVSLCYAGRSTVRDFGSAPDHVGENRMRLPRVMRKGSC